MRWSRPRPRPCEGRAQQPSARGLRGLAQWHDRWHQAHDAHHDDRRAPGLGKRLLVTFVVAFVLSIVAVGVMMTAVLQWNRPNAVAHGLHRQAGHIAERLRFDGDGRPQSLTPASDMDAEWIHGVAAQDWKYRVVDDQGRVVLSSDAGAGPLVKDLPAASFVAGPASFQRTEGGVLLHVVTETFVHEGRPYHVQAAISDRAAALTFGMIVTPVLKGALWVGIFSLVLFAIGMHFTLGYLLRPLREASAAASRIDPRNLQTRLASSRLPRELRPLMAAFNEALDRLEKGYRTQQEFIAAAAHELKTPLALVRGEIELSDGPARDMLLRDIDFMGRQVHQLLHLAEASEARNYVFDPLDLGQVVSEAADLLKRIAAREQVSIDVVQPGAPVVWPADHGAVFVLVKNLMENAVQHSPEGGVVTVRVSEDGIQVCDQGPGIPTEYLPKLFTRFWRGPGRRDSGAGLGLAICAEVALAHGWSITPSSSATGGAVFVIAFRSLA